MSFQAIKAYVRTIFGGLVLVAAILLIVLQWGNDADNFSFYGKVMSDANLAMVMICCVVFGICLPWLGKQFFQGIKGVNRTRQAKDVRQKLKQVDETQKQLKDLNLGDKK